MSRSITLHERLAEGFSSKPDAVLTFLLLAIALGLVVLALWPGHRLIKAATLAWVILP